MLRRTMLLGRLLVLVALLVMAVLPARAATSEPATTPALTATLVTPLDAVAPGATTISAALHFVMEPGWKTYWREPGTVGLPPSIDWSASGNVAEARIAWPVPTRFRAFGIENYGYSGEVAHPIEIRLAEPGARARLDAAVDLLVCAEVCVPERVSLALDLPASGDAAPVLDAGSAALVAKWAGRVPPGERFGDTLGGEIAATGANGASVTAAHLDADALTVRIALDPPVTPDALLDGPDAAVFPALGRVSFDAPDLRLSSGGDALWARLPVVDQPPGPVTGGTLTLALGDLSATVPVALGDAAPPPPDGAIALPVDGVEGTQGAGGGALPLMLLLAFLGGLILNAMPCVLPVLSIKLAGAVAARDRELGEVRAGFLASAAGVVAFALALAGALVALRAGGVAIGWGVQFQSPAFLAAIAAVLTLFGASMLGLIGFRLPGDLETRMARAGGAGSVAGTGRGLGRVPALGRDFLTGAFAALLATPCSAPFLGTAIAFALTASDATLVAVLLALGLGLAFPYLLVAARPSLVRLLPRPGAWMGTLRAVLGVMLLATALWLVGVLASAAGVTVAATVALALFVTLIGLWRVPERRGALASAGVALALLAALVAPPEPAPVAAADPLWRPFERAAIAPAVARGEIVFVDVTADWCLTCKANKAATLDREPVASLLAAPNVTAMRADWTRPDEAIRRYLAAHGRFGIPFNAVYGPAAPDGIPLPELLTPGAVAEAMERAAGA